MFNIPQSAAYTVMFKAFLATDHVTEATGKTIAITISKAGGAFANPNAGATNATEVSSGWYKVSLDATDTATLGALAIRGAVATIDDVGLLYNVTDLNAKIDAIDDFLDTEIAAIKTETASIQADTDNIQTRLPTALVSGKMDSSVVSITSVTGSVGSVTGAVGSVTGNVGGNVNGNVVGSVGSVAGAIASVTTVGSVTGSVGSVTGAVGSVTGNVGGNVTGSVGSVATNGITAASLASDASLEIADALLTRDMSAVSEGSGRTPLQSFRVLRNKWSITAGVLTVTKEDDATPSWTAAVTGTAGADPITTVDPV